MRVTPYYAFIRQLLKEKTLQCLSSHDEIHESFLLGSEESNKRAERNTVKKKRERMVSLITFFVETLSTTENHGRPNGSETRRNGPKRCSTEGGACKPE